MAAGAVCLQRLEGGKRDGIGWNRNVAGLDLLDGGSALSVGFLGLGRRVGEDVGLGEGSGGVKTVAASPASLRAVPQAGQKAAESAVVAPHAVHVMERAIIMCPLASHYHLD